MKAKIYFKALLLVIIFTGCSSPNSVFDDNTVSIKIDVGSHGLQIYQKGQGDIPILFESGLADKSNVWNENGVFDRLSRTTKVIAYNRAGYAPSEPGPEPRTIEQINKETLTLMDALKVDKVILVGHSLAGMFVRSFAINHPERVAGLVFLDPSHEDYKSKNDPGAQAAIDYFGKEFGQDDIRYKEAKELPNTFEYVDNLPNLPDVPVVVISSMKIDGNKDKEDRKKWFEAHARLGEGISDFRHLGTSDSGHYIMIDESNLVVEVINELISKIEL